MDTPQFVGVVLDGNGAILDIEAGDSKPDVEGLTMRRYVDQQDIYDQQPADQRPADPPMWDVYIREARQAPTSVQRT